MRMFNLDGSEGKMCGNAIRCVAKYLYDNRIIQNSQMSIETLSGIKKLYLITQNGFVSSVKVDMGRAVLEPEKIPVKISGETAIAKPVTIGNKDYTITCVSMGNPHAVAFIEDVENFPVSEIGPLFEKNSLFPDRVNTEFIEVMDRNHLKMRVWERGSGETLACGTGACASAVAAVLNGHCDKGADVKVQLLGGELIINYTDEAVFMTVNVRRCLMGWWRYKNFFYIYFMAKEKLSILKAGALAGAISLNAAACSSPNEDEYDNLKYAATAYAIKNGFPCHDASLGPVTVYTESGTLPGTNGEKVSYHYPNGKVHYTKATEGRNIVSASCASGAEDVGYPLHFICFPEAVRSLSEACKRDITKD